MQVAIISLIAALVVPTIALGQQGGDDSSVMIGPWRIEVIGSRRWSTGASADRDAVTIALTDSVPLDKSTAAFDRLETCYEKNSRSPETNPFVAPGRNP